MKPVKANIFKIFIIIIVSIVLLLSVSAALFVYFFPKEKVQELIISSAEESLKRKISLVEIDYGIRGIFLKKVKIYDGLSEEDTILAEADSVNLGISLLPLLQKKLNINQIYFSNLNLNILYDDTGKSNIEKLINQLSDKKGSSSVSTKISNIKLDNAKIVLTNPPEILKPLAGIYHVNSNLEIVKNKIIVSNCRIALPGKRGVVFPDITINTKKDDFEITGNAGLDKVSLQWVYKWASNPKPYNIVTCDVENLKITKNIVEGYARGSSTLTKSKKIVHGNGYFKVNIKNRTVFLSNLKGSIGTSALVINNLLITFDPGVINFNINNIDANITDMKPLLYFLPISSLFGKVQGNLTYNKDAYNGTLNLINIGYDIKEKIISDLNTTLIIKNNTFTNKKIPLKINGNPSFASIASTDSHLKKIFLNVNIENFIISPGTKKKSAKTKIKNIPVDIAGTLNIKNIKYKKTNLSNLQINYIYSGNRVSLNKFSAGLMDGRISGTGSIITSGYSPKANANLSFNKIKVQDVLASNEKFKNRFFGIINGRANLNFIIGDNMFDSLNGKVEFSIDRGKVVNTGIQNGLGILLSELRFKLKDLEFNKIYGNISINNTYYLINSFIFSSEDIRLKINGLINQELIATNMKIGLDFTQRFIQDIAIASFALRKDPNSKWYIKEFLANGDITESKNIKLIR